jgi:hypothetical protein
MYQVITDFYYIYTELYVFSFLCVSVFFGGLGFLLGTSVLNFDFHWRDLTAVTLLIEVLMGIYVFVIFTLEVPIHWGGHTQYVGVVGAPFYPVDSFTDYEVNLTLR